MMLLESIKNFTTTDKKCATLLLHNLMIKKKTFSKLNVPHLIKH